jgi:ketosteroid isomerase-like protein
MADVTTNGTAATREAIGRRLEVVKRMFAGEASYDEVLEFHAEDFVWLSPAGAVQGHAAARDHQEQRMRMLPEGALDDLSIRQIVVHGDFAFTRYRTRLVPFGTDSYVVRDGKVVFQSNAFYLPRQ